jgi:hypothetical protein
MKTTVQRELNRKELASKTSFIKTRKEKNIQGQYWGKNGQYWKRKYSRIWAKSDAEIDSYNLLVSLARESDPGACAS